MNIIETNLGFSSLSYRTSTEVVILHHAASSKASVQDIHKWHKNQGWSGIGYHYYVRKDGSIYRGRPETAIGAHAVGANYNSIGICAEGDFTVESMGDSQKNSIVTLVKNIKSRYAIKRVIGHREVPNQTSCPGGLYPLQQIRQLIGESSSVVIDSEQNNIQQNISNAQTSLNDKIQKGKAYVGTRAAELQQKLNRVMGYDLVVDGVFGPKTYGALIAFQKKYGLAVDGLAGVNTFKKLDELTRSYDFRSLQSYIGAVQDNIPGSETLSKTPLVKLGSTGNVVRWIQNRLNYLGYNSGGADSIFGQNTLSEVKRFQRAKGISQDGIVGQNTWRKLLGL